MIAFLVTGPYVKKKVEISESLTLWSVDTTTRARDIVADYVTGMLGLTRDAADYVMEAPRRCSTT